ncbi:MAG: hypothetical protein K9J06_02460 [Flavobacteriales bacterium]|nr:hypothetical protein [Flavobacteriales bacterium]
MEQQNIDRPGRNSENAQRRSGNYEGNWAMHRAARVFNPRMRAQGSVEVNRERGAVYSEAINSQSKCTK